MALDGILDSVELWRWTLAPNQSHHSDVHAPGTRELMHVLDGRMTLRIGAEVVTLEAGDAIAFDGHVPHTLVGAGATGASFVHAVLERRYGIRQ